MVSLSHRSSDSSGRVCVYPTLSGVVVVDFT